VDYDTLAAAFALLYGNPPKSLVYRHGLFEARDAKAQKYRSEIEKCICEQHPHATNTREKVKRRRNDVLRALYKQLGITSK
jgi:hypothetical protein